MDWTNGKRAQRREREERAKAFKRHVHPSNRAEYLRYVAYIGGIELYRHRNRAIARDEATTLAIAGGYDPNDVVIEAEYAIAS